MKYPYGNFCLLKGDFMTFAKTPYLWDEWCCQAGSFPCMLYCSSPSDTLFSTVTFLSVYAWSKLFYRQPKQILNILSYKLFRVNTNTAWTNAWSRKIHLSISPFLTYPIHYLLPTFPSVICSSVHHLLHRKEPRAKTSPGIAGPLQICANYFI